MRLLLIRLSLHIYEKLSFGWVLVLLNPLKTGPTHLGTKYLALACNFVYVLNGLSE